MTDTERIAVAMEALEQLEEVNRQSAKRGREALERLREIADPTPEDRSSRNEEGVPVPRVDLVGKEQS